MRGPKSILCLFLFFYLYNCGPLAPEDWAPSMMMVLGFGGGTTNPNGPKTLSPGQPVTFGGGVTGTAVDTNGDGVVDAISIGGSVGGTTPPALILIDSDGDGVPNGVDANGDGVIDYYIAIGNNGSITLTTQPNGGGNPVTIVPGQGFDSNGDGIVDNPILAQLASDTILPTSLITPAGGTYPSARTLTILCSDNIAPSNIVYTTDGAVPGFSPASGIIKNPPSASFTVGSGGNGTYTVRYLCRDMSGNLSTLHTDTYVIDSNVPSVTANLASVYVSNVGGAIGSSLLTWSSNVSGTYSVRSGGTDCTDGTELTNGSVTAAISNTATTFSAASLSIGNTTIRICVTNPNNGFIGSYALTITRDDTPPTVTASPVGGSYNTLVSISLTCNDAGGAGCDKIAYISQVGSVPADPAITGTNGNIISGSQYASAISATDQATTYIKYLARDQAGNVSTVSSENYIVDTIVPIPSQVSVLGVGAEVFVQWAPVSGATEYRIYYNNSGSVTTSSTSITGISNLYYKISGLTTDTMYYVRVEARNSGGSASLLSPEQRVFTTSTSPGTAASGSYADLSAGQGADSGSNLQALIDFSSAKLLIVAENAANNSKPSLFRCDLDGSNCIHTDISAGQGANSGQNPFAIIDTISQKLIIVTRNGANNNKPSLFRCNLDGSNCVHTDISAGQGTSSGETPFVLIDSISSKLLIVTTNAGNDGKLSLFRCDLDGSNCAHTDISAGQGFYSGISPSASIDFVSNKLLVVTINLANNSKPSFFRCNLDGSNCAHTDISVGQGASSGGGGGGPSINIDSTSGKLLVVTVNGANNIKPSLFRCDLDGSNCIHTDISAGQGANSGYESFSLIDSISQKLITVSRNEANSGKLGLFRCNLDGSSCTYTDISTGQGTSSGFSPFATIDPTTGKLLVVTKNGANSNRPALFRW